jgi:hypothetical protein
MKHTISSSLATLLLAGTAWSHVAGAGTPISEQRAVNADARIDVSNIKGAVTVSAWDKAEVAVSGTLGDGAKALLVEGGGSHLTIKVEVPERQGWFDWGSDTRMGDTLLDIKVPKNAEMKIDVVSADVTLAGVAGRSLDVDSVSGRLRLDSGAKEIDVESVSGDVDLAGTADRSHLESVSGNLRARGLTGEMKLETVSGDIDVEGGIYREIGAVTVSGDINLRGKPAAGARVDVETMSGDVHLHLPSDTSARMRASTFSGSIRSDFGTPEEPEHGPGSSLDATSGDGNSQIGIETFSGDIEIRKQ